VIELSLVWLGALGGLVGAGSALVSALYSRRCQRLGEAFDPKLFKLELHQCESRMLDQVETYRKNVKVGLEHAEATYDSAVEERELAKRDYGKARGAEFRARQAAEPAAEPSPEQAATPPDALLVGRH